ncbi:unnamed protein product [Calicophoron daubneyi]|uniref:MYND-type domain-containing protein n=1 Tax=Calicophoron daubneyi TaxID=300641 RepID=A0AAV2TC77_CALDB
MDDSKEQITTIPCTTCGMRAKETDALICGSCNAVAYCSQACKLFDWVCSDNVEHSHERWCSTMKAFMTVEPRLRDIPLSFAPSTTAPDFTDRQLAQFLLARGLFEQGLWKYECHFDLGGMSWDSVSSPGGELYLFSALWASTSLEQDLTSSSFNQSAFVPNCGPIPYEDAMLRAYVSPSDAILLSLPPFVRFPSVATGSRFPTLVSVVLRNWSEYYSWRGLGSPQDQPDSSPLAILLHWPLTIYQILASVLPKNYPQTILSVCAKRTLVVHIVGAEHELSLLPVFKELDYLIRPELQIRLFFIGTYIDPSVNKRIFHLSSRLSAVTWNGVYHQFLQSGLSHADFPDVIIGFNVGLAAYSSWVPTLKKISELAVPCYFTDACLYSCAWGYRVTSSLGLGSTVYQPDVTNVLDENEGSGEHAPLLNPFRSPIRMRSAGVRWGWFRNAFIFAPLRPALSPSLSFTDAVPHTATDLSSKLALLQM